MQKWNFHFHVGMRTFKTALSVYIAMALVDAYGVTPSKLIFAMLGAMAAVQPTHEASWKSCLTQIVGVLFGALVGIVLLLLPIPRLWMAGIGIILVITLYNGLHIRFSPEIPCLIVVILCTTEGIEPFSYAAGRIWDTAIGLLVGIVINMTVFPYNGRGLRKKEQ